MKHPSPRAKEPSITSVLKKISDDTLILFNIIAVSSSNSDRYIPLKEMNLSTKQYYSRIGGLLEAGMIKRHKGKYFLTLLGKVVYDSQMIIGKTLSYYWKLRAIESMEMSTSELPSVERSQLIDALIDNHQIKDIFMKSISNPSIESNSGIQTQHQ
jgi:predicted transcriptional regulator